MNEQAELENKAFRVILLGVEEVVGKGGTETILRQAGLAQYIHNYPPSDKGHGGHKPQYMTQINHALFDVYGRRGARAILMRTGRGRARNAIEENGALATAIRFATKLLPRHTKVKMALDTSAKEYSEQLSTTVKIEDDGEYLYWEDSMCGNCIDWRSEQPVCYTTVGFIHGLLAWLLEDENFKVEEITCRAKGDAVCRYRIALRDAIG
jgi:predicted hydrocarbon binding protein